LNFLYNKPSLYGYFFFFLRRFLFYVCIIHKLDKKEQLQSGKLLLQNSSWFSFGFASGKIYISE